MANSPISVEYAMLSDVSDRMPRNVRMESATTTMVSLPSLMVPAELAAGVVRWLCRSSWMLTVLLVVLASSALTAAGDIRISYCLAYI